MYERYCELREKAGVTDSAVAKATGIGRSTFSDWKSGRSIPKNEKLLKIADYFGVSVAYLTTGKDTEKTSTSGRKYYFSDETAEVAQTLMERKEERLLFDAARDAKPEDLMLAADLLKRLKETNPDG